ncbi:GntR family transcriptional regulator, partial [Micrococcus endophyticus]
MYAALIEAISTGRIPAGERLPSEEAMAAHFKVAAMTLRQA